MSIAHGERVVHAGQALATARAAMILLHGRGATAEDILTIATDIERPDLAYLAPEAAGNAWYPNPFTAALESNEPYFSAALETVSKLFAQISETIPAERIVVLGFSQGGCLALEWGARNAQRLGAVVGLSAGLIGPDGTPREYPGGFADTPAFLGCSDMDPFIPRNRVEEAADVYRRLGADVTLRLYPGMPHLVSADEIAEIRKLVAAL